MHCAACANRNERASKSLPGVREAAVNFALRSARVEFDPALVSERALHEAVIANGFQVLDQRICPGEQGTRAAGAEDDARWRAFAALALSAPVMLLAMLEIELPWSFAGRNASLWLQAVLSSIVILGLGWRVSPRHGAAGAARRGQHGHADLARHAVGARSTAFGALAVGEPHLYFETGAVIAALILLGRYFEARSRGQASAAIEKLMDLGAKTARVIRDGGEQEIADRRCQGRRRPAGEAGREDSRRRQGRRRPLHRR